MEVGTGFAAVVWVGIWIGKKIGNRLAIEAWNGVWIGKKIGKRIAIVVWIGMGVGIGQEFVKAVVGSKNKILDIFPGAWVETGRNT